MFDSPIDEIKNRLSVVEVIREYLKLEKTGVNYRALCPFHPEKTPSFFVSPTRQRWHCFGACSEGGDIFKFIMKIEGVEFSDALQILAAKVGIELKKQDPKIKTERQKTLEVCEWATRFFEKKINNSILQYLSSRGIGGEEVRGWRIGYAPDSWNELFSFLSAKGYSGQEIEKSGLVGQKEGSLRYYDRFRGRIIFPIFDLNSQPIGFGGRIFGDKEREKKEVKYLNTPNTILYDKSRVLYGLDRAKMEIRRKDCCILMEGYTDVIMSHKVGINHSVAASGTALGREQLFIIKRYTNNLILAFDRDMAGEIATRRGIDLALSMDFNIKIAIMPLGMDPAEMIFKEPENWQKTINKAISIMDFYFQQVLAKWEVSQPENKKKIGEALLPEIMKILNNIERHHWIQKLALILGVNEGVLIEEIKKIKNFSSEKIRTEEKKEKRDRKEALEERLLMFATKDYSILKNLSQDDKSNFSETHQKIITFLNGEKKEISLVIKEKIEYLTMKMDLEEEIETDKEAFQCLSEMRLLILKERMKTIKEKIKEAETQNDNETVARLINDFNLLSSLLERVKRES